MELPQRRPNRLSDYDYSQNGACFITICTQDRKPILSKIVGGGALDAPQRPYAARYDPFVGDDAHIVPKTTHKYKSLLEA